MWKLKIRGLSSAILSEVNCTNLFQRMVPKQLIIVFLFAAANNIVGLLHYTSLEDASAATVVSSSASHQPDAKIKMTVVSESRTHYSDN